MSHLVNSEAPLVAAEYVTLVLPEIDWRNEASIKEFKRNVILQAQGEPVIFEENLFTPVTAALAFGAIADVATQILIRLTDGRLMMIFDHETRGFLPGLEIDMSTWEAILESRKHLQFVSDVALPRPELVVDLGEGELAEVAKQLQPCMTLQLKGEVSLLSLLAAIYLARPTCRTMDYVDGSGQTVNIFA